MSDPITTSALLDGRAPAGARAMQSSFLWMLASLATAVAIFAVTLLLWAQNQRAAGRMIIVSQKADGYLPTLTAHVPAMHGRLLGH